ncbi:MAG: Uma2 family endonuclease [Armatimonadetes bacterium]|nr:Uma2 family endonuclease [Armatimonadota bacterium]
MAEEEFMRLPKDGYKYELVAGEAIAVPTSIRHDAIIARLIIRLGPYAEAHGILCGSTAGFRMASGNIRCPDIAFIRYERLPDGEPPEGSGEAAPDLAAEVISPSENRTDIFRRIGEYFEAGSEQVWLLDPETRWATVYRSLIEVAALKADDELEGGSLLPGFRCPAADLFRVRLKG